MSKSKAILCAIALSFAAPACTSTAESICDAKCDCEGCSAREYDECLFKHDDNLRDADRYDCGPEYDDLLACQDETGRCGGGRDWDTNCGFEKDRFKRCTDR